MKRMGMLGVSVRKTKALTVKMQAVTLTGKRTLKMKNTCITCTKLIAKYLFFIHV
jgi:hypothetical protein